MGFLFEVRIPKDSVVFLFVVERGFFFNDFLVSKDLKAVVGTQCSTLYCLEKRTASDPCSLSGDSSGRTRKERSWTSFCTSSLSHPRTVNSAWFKAEKMNMKSKRPLS